MTGPGTRFGTRFDEPARPLVPPGVIAQGNHPALRLTDGIMRSEGTAARVVRPSGLLGIKVAASGGIRVEIALAGTRKDPRPALVDVRCGGVSRLVLVQSGRLNDPATHTLVRFSVPAAAVPPEGLLLIELLDASGRVPKALAARLAPRGVWDLRLLTIRIDPAGQEERLRRAAAPGGMCVIPAGTIAPVRLQGAFGRPLGPGLPANPGTTAKAPSPAAEDGRAPGGRGGRLSRLVSGAGRIVRAISIRTPATVQRFAVAANLRLLGGRSLKRISAVDLDTGEQFGVTAQAHGASILLTPMTAPRGAWLVVLPPRRRTLTGCAARWITWTAATSAPVDTAAAHPTMVGNGGR